VEECADSRAGAVGVVAAVDGDAEGVGEIGAVEQADGLETHVNGRMHGIVMWCGFHDFLTGGFPVQTIFVGLACRIDGGGGFGAIGDVRAADVEELLKIGDEEDLGSSPTSAPGSAGGSSPCNPKFCH